MTTYFAIMTSVFLDIFFDGSDKCTMRGVQIRLPPQASRIEFRLHLKNELKRLGFLRCQHEPVLFKLRNSRRSIIPLSSSVPENTPNNPYKLEINTAHVQPKRPRVPTQEHISSLKLQAEYFLKRLHILESLCSSVVAEVDASSSTSRQVEIMKGLENLDKSITEIKNLFDRNAKQLDQWEGSISQFVLS